MRYLGIAVMFVVGLCLCGAQAYAARCSGISPVTFCDDFDRYCSPVPSDPDGACPCNDNVRDQAALEAAWPALPRLLCGSGDYAYHDLLGPGSWKCDANQGFGMRVFQSAQVIRLTRRERNMSPELLANPLNTSGYGAVNGAGEISLPLTTANKIPGDYIDSMNRSLRPGALKGQFFMNFGGVGAYSRMVSYVELFLDEDRAPFDWEMAFCPWTPNAQARNFPRLIRTDGQVHASFALGVVAIMDSNPCDLDTGWYPTHWRFVVYDGRTWQQFQAPRFDIPLTSPADESDLYPKDGYNFVYFSIGADYIEVRLRNGESQDRFNQGRIPNPWWVARVPRQYKGPFNRIAVGPNYGTDLTNATCTDWGFLGIPIKKCNGGANDGLACTTDTDCPASTADCSPQIKGLANNLMIEELVIYDGVFQGASRACCKPDLTCVITDPDSCQALGGVYKADQTSCQETTCCPIPFADSDNDDDVDMADFAAIQRCMNTGPGSPPTLGAGCGCFDKNKNGIIDETDLENFIKCGTGDAVPWVASPDCPQ